MLNLLKRKNIRALALGFVIGLGAFWYFQGSSAEGINIVAKAVFLIAVAAGLAVLTSPRQGE